LWFVRAVQAHAGGFELPDNGTEALGRGGAFTAKADDGTALQYNVAGFAQQRGTKLLVNTNLWFSQYSFQRAGNYPDDPANTLTPWGGSRFPKIQDESGMFPEPFLAASSDFGYFDRWTFAVGAFGPSAIGNRTFPESLGFAPNPARYDVVENHPQVIYFTGAASFRAFDWLDLGVALHYTYAKLHISQATLSDAVARGRGAGQCANVEYQPCDARSTLDTTGGTPTASFGALAHPIPELSIGANFRGPVKLTTEGDVNVITPRITPNAVFHPSPITFVVRMPAVLRVGARYSFLEKKWDDSTWERADIEVNGTWEGWGSAQDDGLHVIIPRLDATNPPPGVNLTGIDFISPHHYQNTWSIRVGGAYNIPLKKNTLVLRAGMYHDSSASDPQYTRLDFDTLAKTAGTAGVGFKIDPFELNLAYAEVFSAARTVEGGELRPVNGALQGRFADVNNTPYPSVNAGHYEGHTRVVSLGATVYFDGLIGPKRHGVAPKAKAPEPPPAPPPTPEPAPPPPEPPPAPVDQNAAPPGG
jgi:long-subunit fatty acid transport protein